VTEYQPPISPDKAPLIKLRLHLEDARARGVEFGDAWAPAVMEALKGLSLDERREWRTFLFRTQETWQACFERRPQEPVERQLSFISAERGEVAA
jgi:hypothetical protein